MNNTLFRPLGTTLVALTLLFFIASCDKSDDESGLEGFILNTTGLGVEGAEVALFPESGGTAVASTTTNSLGFYRLETTTTGNVRLRVSATGYTTGEQSLVFSGNTSRVDTLYGLGSLTGRIRDSQNAQGLDSALVLFCFGTDTSRIALRALTNSAGDYILRNVPVGSFSVVIKHPRFFTQVIPNVAITPGTQTPAPITIVQRLTGSGFRIVLTWGLNPRDLDSHLSGPDSATSGTRFHVYFSNRRPTGAGAALDVDITSGYGPETITISGFRTGLYRYSIHNYSNSSTSGAMGIDTSGAVVEVYNNSGLINRFTPPRTATSSSGNVWRVFEIDVVGTTPTLRAVNTYQQANGAGDNTIFALPRNGKISYDVD